MQVTQLESKLRNMESLLQSGVDPTQIGPVGELCVQCSQSDAVLPAPTALQNKHKVESLIRCDVIWLLHELNV